MDPRKQIVRDAYDKISERYLKWSSTSKVRTHYLEKFLSLLPQGANVLELGCGAGIPVTQALAQHAKVTGVDISPAQAALARKNAPSARIVCADMMELEFPPAGFDAVCAFYAITHLPREEHRELFRRIAMWLKPGGYFLASLGVSETDGRTEDWLGAPNYFSQHSAAENLRLIESVGLVIARQEITQQDLKDEKGLPFLWIVAEKS